MITRRRMLVAGGGLAALAAAGQALATTVPTTRRMLTMEITRNGSQPSGKETGRLVHRRGAGRPALPGA